MLLRFMRLLQERAPEGVNLYTDEDYRWAEGLSTEEQQNLLDAMREEAQYASDNLWQRGGDDLLPGSVNPFCAAGFSCEECPYSGSNRVCNGDVDLGVTLESGTRVLTLLRQVS